MWPNGFFSFDPEQDEAGQDHSQTPWFPPGTNQQQQSQTALHNFTFQDYTSPSFLPHFAPVFGTPQQYLLYPQAAAGKSDDRLEHGGQQIFEQTRQLPGLLAQNQSRNDVNEDSLVSPVASIEAMGSPNTASPALTDVAPDDSCTSSSLTYPPNKLQLDARAAELKEKVKQSRGKRPESSTAKRVPSSTDNNTPAVPTEADIADLIADIQASSCVAAAARTGDNIDVNKMDGMTKSKQDALKEIPAIDLIDNHGSIKETRRGAQPQTSEGTDSGSVAAVSNASLEKSVVTSDSLPASKPQVNIAKPEPTNSGSQTSSGLATVEEGEFSPSTAAGPELDKATASTDNKSPSKQPRGSKNVDSQRKSEGRSSGKPSTPPIGPSHLQKAQGLVTTSSQVRSHSSTPRYQGREQDKISSAHDVRKDSWRPNAVGTGKGASPNKPGRTESRLESGTNLSSSLQANGLREAILTSTAPTTPTSKHQLPEGQREAPQPTGKQVTISIPSTGSYREEEDVIRWLERSGYYDDATRMPVVKRWHHIAELLKEDQDTFTTRRPQPVQDPADNVGNTMATDIDKNKNNVEASRPGKFKRERSSSNGERLGGASRWKHPRLERSSPRRRTTPPHTVLRDRIRLPCRLSDRRSRSPPLHQMYGDNDADYRRDAYRGRSMTPRNGGGGDRQRQHDSRSMYGHQHYGKHQEQGNSDGGRSRDEGDNAPKVDLGRRGESRFFIVKSFSEENVVKSMKEGLWTTQEHNGKVFAKAYHNCKTVILFFSANQSHAFQGYARMTSGLLESMKHLKGIDSLLWRPTAPFRVDWLCTRRIHFSFVHHLRNDMNEGLPVQIGRDGQEVAEGCARRLMELMETPMHRLRRQPSPDDKFTNQHRAWLLSDGKMSKSAIALARSRRRDEPAGKAAPQLKLGNYSVGGPKHVRKAADDEVGGDHGNESRGNSKASNRKKDGEDSPHLARTATYDGPSRGLDYAEADTTDLIKKEAEEDLDEAEQGPANGSLSAGGIQARPL